MQFAYTLTVPLANEKTEEIAAITQPARAQTATAISPPVTKAHLSMRPTITLTLIAMRTSSIRKHARFIGIEPRPPSGGQTQIRRPQCN